MRIVLVAALWIVATACVPSPYHVRTVETDIEQRALALPSAPPAITIGDALPAGDLGFGVGGSISASGPPRVLGTLHAPTLIDGRLGVGLGRGVEVHVEAGAADPSGVGDPGERWAGRLTGVPWRGLAGVRYTHPLHERVRAQIGLAAGLAEASVARHVEQHITESWDDYAGDAGHREQKVSRDEDFRSTDAIGAMTTGLQVQAHGPWWLGLGLNTQVHPTWWGSTSLVQTCDLLAGDCSGATDRAPSTIDAVVVPWLGAAFHTPVGSVSAGAWAALSDQQRSFGGSVSFTDRISLGKDGAEED